jgi:hypothetical protein
MDELLNDVQCAYSLFRETPKNVYYTLGCNDITTYNKETLDYFYKINLVVDVIVSDDYFPIKDSLNDINVYTDYVECPPFIIQNNFAIFSMKYVNKIDMGLITTYVNKYCMVDKIGYKEFILLDLNSYKNKNKQNIYIKTLLKKLTRKATYFYIKIATNYKYNNICNIKKIFNIIKNYNNFFYTTYIKHDNYYDIWGGMESYNSVKLYNTIAVKIIKKFIYNKLLYSFIVNLIR